MGALDYCSPNNYDAAAMDVLYRNDGGGRFTDVSLAAGIGSSFGNGLGVVFGDYDDDGWLDVFVANDGRRDQLWINQRDGTFADEALIRGCAVDRDTGMPKAGMGVTSQDVDRDGDLDIMVCNLVNESDSVWRNEGRQFDDMTGSAGLAGTADKFTRFGLGWIDFDLDGWFDLYEANGRVMKEHPNYTSNWYDEPNLVFAGGPDRFVEVEPRGGTAEPVLGSSRAAAFGDVDGDGAVDVLVSNNHGAAHLLLNRVGRRGNHVVLDVRERSGRPALGARVDVTIAGDRRRFDVRSEASYLACNDPRITVGLGDARMIDAIEVAWVDGETTIHEGVAAGKPSRSCGRVRACRT